jgi:hypothetical protein
MSDAYNALERLDSFWGNEGWDAEVSDKDRERINEAFLTLHRALSPVDPIDDRAAFEAHFDLSSRQAWRTKEGKEYRDQLVQLKWMGWQAARENAKA